jgi:hypothetical protein
VMRLVSRARIDRSSHGAAPSFSNIAMLSATPLPNFGMC